MKKERVALAIEIGKSGALRGDATSACVNGAQARCVKR